MADEKNQKKYYLGLDMGTGSVGWATTDESYNLLQYRKKDIWGANTFETGKTAKARRLLRGARRRKERRKNRLMLLQELFAEEINKVDPGFFHRLQDSAFLEEDKRQEQKYSLFNDANYTDCHFYKNYPSIHHLIKALIEGKAEKDVRLLYLACHNIIKYRGHFLFASESFDTGNQFLQSIENLLEYMREDLELEIDWDATIIIKILKDKTLSMKAKKDEIKSNFGVKNKQLEHIINLFVGLKADFATIYNNEELKELEIKDLTLSKDDFDTKEEKMASLLDEKFELILRARAIYNASLLDSILNDEKYLSFAKVKTYNKHKEDLAKLKKLAKSKGADKTFAIGENTKISLYNAIFRSEKVANNYPAYVGINKIQKVKHIIGKSKRATQDGFYDFIKNALKANLENPQEHAEYQAILSEIELKTFLPKQVDKKNSEIPYQLRKQELELILTNAKADFAFLDVKDAKGLSVADKILKLLTFKIPYYIGITNASHRDKFPDRCWVVKQADATKEKLTPWNFYEQIDEEATAEAFINSRTNKCTYLVGEDVLPRHSLLYSEYTVLNEMNNIKIIVNGRDISSKELINLIIANLFKKHKQVTQKQILNLMVREGITQRDDKVSITGIDKDCTSSLTSYIDLKKIFGERIEEDGMQKMLEDIILWISIYDQGEGRRLLEHKIDSVYPNALTADEMKRVLSLKFSGWAKFSHAFLEDILAPMPILQGKKVNIINALRQSKYNLMQLLSTNLDFHTEIDQRNAQLQQDDFASFSYEKLVKDSYLSPSVKRVLWQTLKLVNEIRSIHKGDPERIFIEMARSEEEKKRTNSRSKIIANLYKECRKNAKDQDWNKYINSLSAQLKQQNNLKLRSDKLYFYFTQFAKCMYCGKSIDLESVFNTNLYDKEHIYPQSKIKDDSMNNRVLTCRTCNGDKENNFPLKPEIRKRQAKFWEFLNTHNFISTEKFTRLMRNTPLTDDEMGDFLARQLVQTRQGTKLAGSILQNLMPNTKIIYSKAGHVSEFRQKFDIYKCREINDFHHAHDAYLNIVVGNVYYTKYTEDPRNFYRNKTHKEKHQESNNFYKVFDYNVERNGKIAWQTDKDKSIGTVKNTLERNTPICTRLSYCKQSEFFAQNLLPKGKGQFPRKASLPITAEARASINKYGGYNSVKVAYLILIEQEIKKKLQRSLEVVPVYLIEAIKKDKNILHEYLADLLGTKDYKIIVPKIKVNALLIVNGFPCYIKAKTNNSFEVDNAVQFFTNLQDTLYFKHLYKVHKPLKDEKESKKDEEEKSKKDEENKSKKDEENKSNKTEEKKKVKFTAYDEYALRMYVKDKLCKKPKEKDIDQAEFESALKAKNLEVYKMLVDKHKTTYKNRPNSATLQILIDGEAAFIALDLDKQLLTLEEILRLFRPINEKCNLTDIQGKEKAGKMKIGKNLSSLNSCILVHQSITGIWEQKLDLLNCEAQK